MKSKGRIRKFFPGANSAYGFYSYYDHLCGPAAAKVFILKGGPGTGKSTLMYKIGEKMRSDGFTVEYHYCSANPACLDGINIPAIGVALLDGTAPHVVDPRYPGAVDEIINLGAYWDEAFLTKNRGPIRSLIDGIAPLYRQAYVYLSAAKSYRQAADSYPGVSDHSYKNALASLTHELIEEIFGNKVGNGGRGKMRKLFVSAITSRGTLHFLEELLAPFSLVYILSGEDGQSKKNVIAQVAEAAVLRGFYVEAFSCALDPVHIDHLLIPELEVALVNSVEPHCPAQGELYRCVETSRFILKLPEREAAEREEFLHNYKQALRNAVTFLEKAAQRHEELEQYYIPAMRFKEIEALREELLEKIFRFVAN